MNTKNTKLPKLFAPFTCKLDKPPNLVPRIFDV